MKKITTLLVFMLLLISSITAYAEDYALINHYPLLNDMKVANKQQLIIDHIEEILNQSNKDRDTFNTLEKEFNQALIGLIEGDEKMKLKGTKIATLRGQLNSIKTLWNQEKITLINALNSDKRQEKALETLHKLSTKLETLNECYKKSYKQYKLNSTFSSIVKQHTYNHLTRQRLALNIIN
ncbi:MAG: hypothetical protein KU29_04280 [Sulfurovum sp. FS06-10]|nr:MAG: hypothetical protein KU29_04280 [Sulfurovum sp. FS06-10]